MSTTYYVWRRLPDGHIGSTVYMPSGWIQPSDGTAITFDLIGKFHDWSDAFAVIAAKRAPSEETV